MLTQFESKSNRVKGLSFHPTRPWLLSSLHNGIIQLWDYRIKTLLDRFDEHDGPVRGICFHSTQPLFVSGGDDYKIKVWNHKTRRCLFTLLGHLDYIRTVEFHVEYPWILSASDDQTIRIWNWQARSCIAVLTGHNHYVMCASFHSKEDMVVSASLDQTVRVWDISGLRKKTVSIGGGVTPGDDPRLPNDIFGNSDAIVKYVLEGHDRGVNWAAFHPTSPLIISGADDRQVKLWRMNDTKAWEVDTFRGHFNNVSCALFHPRLELVLSNSEDKTIRVWDLAKRQGIQTFRREHDRFWIMAAHPHQNLFAAGHDSGLIVFKLERERPCYTPAQKGEALLYIKDRHLRAYEFDDGERKGRDTPLLPVRRASAGAASARSVAYSVQDGAALVCWDVEGGHYELFTLAKPGTEGSGDSKRGVGSCGVFVGRKRFAILDKSSHIVVKNLKNEETKRCVPPHPCDMLFAAPVGMLLLRSEDRVTLYDLQQRRALAEVTTPLIKYVFWSHDKQPLVALVGKDTIIICNKSLEQLCTIHETIRIKSGCWDEGGVFIYNTQNHLKYCLPNGDNGIIRTLDVPVYLAGVRGDSIYCLDRDCKTRKIMVDTTEYRFKDALIKRKYDIVLRMVKESRLIGQAIIAYLQRKGFPEVALHFVRDEKTRFSLALECGNIEVALESAKLLNDKDCWLQLGTEALRQGNHPVVEMAYQRTRNFERLSFLYLITGNIPKLQKMLQIAEMREDVMSRYHNALYLGDVQEQINILRGVGQTGLAYMAANVHSLDAAAASLVEALAAKQLDPPAAPPIDFRLLQPPVPIMRLHDSVWPLLTVSKGYFQGAGADDNRLLAAEVDDGAPAAAEGDWSDGEGEQPQQQQRAAPGGDDGEGGGGGDWDSELTLPGDEKAAGEGWDEELPIDAELDKIDLNAKVGRSVAAVEQQWVSPGVSAPRAWARMSSLAADHAAAGSFETFAQILNQQIAVVNFEPLKAHYVAQWIACRAALPGLPSTNSMLTPLLRKTPAEVPAAGADSKRKRGAPGAAVGIDAVSRGLPVLALSLPPQIERLHAAYKSTTEGKFTPALVMFQQILHAIPMLVVDSKQDQAEIKELIGLCREYILGLRIEVERKNQATAGADPKRVCELASYFTHCNLQAVHLVLSLRSAMNAAYKLQNYQTSASFARRLLELNPKPDIATQARKVVKFAEMNNTNAVELAYDERNPFFVCGYSFVPLYKGHEVVRCPFCSSAYLPEHAGKVCPTCQLSQIGKEVSGLQLVFGGQRER